MIKNENNNSLELQEAFNLFDSNKDGLLSLNELQNGLESIGEYLNMNELKDLISPFVKNTDSPLNYDGQF